MEGEAERRADRARPDDPRRWEVTRTRPNVRVRVPVRVDLTIAVPVVTRGDRIEIDAGPVDRGGRLGAVALGIVARQPAPGLQRGPPRRPDRRARYACIQSSLARRRRGTR
jgi:hypothetical protein